MNDSCWLRLIVLGGWLLAAAQVQAQFTIPTDGGIQATGSAAVPLRPERMWMRIELVARGDSILDAMAKLKILKERDSQQLGSLKAIPESIQFGPPGIVRNRPTAEAAAAEEAEAAAAEKPEAKPAPAAGAAAPAADPDAAPPPRKVAASMSLTAEWKLKSVEPADLAVEIATLQQRIQEANLSKLKGAKPDDDDDSDDEDEEANNRFGFPAASLGRPRFLFLAHLPLDDQQKCTVRAVARARAEADHLAHGAGTTLRSLRSLRVPTSTEESLLEMYNPDISPTAHLLHVQNADKQETEVWGKDWRTLEFRAKVVATFEPAAP